MIKPGRPRPPCHATLAWMTATLLLLGVASASLGQTPPAALWQVITYEIPTGLLEVEFDGAAVRGSGPLPDVGPSVSRRQLRLRVPDVSQLTRLELGGVALPLNRTEILRDVFAARGRHIVLDLLVNGTYRMVVVSEYRPPTPTLVAAEEGSRDSLTALAMAALAEDAYSPLPYRLFLRRTGDENPLRALSPEHRKACIGYVAQSLMSTYSPERPSGSEGRGINVPALFTLLTSSEDRNDKAAYQDLLIMSPGFAPAHARLAHIYYTGRKYGLAVLHLYTAIASNPGDVFGIDRGLRTLGGKLRASLANGHYTVATQRASASALRHTLESVLSGHLDATTRWHASIPAGIEDRAAYNTDEATSQDPLQRALDGRSAAGVSDKAAARQWNRLIMALTAGSDDVTQYDDARWRLAETEPESEYQRVLNSLVTGSPQRDEVELARALTALHPHSPVYANNLAAVYGQHRFRRAAIHELCRALSVAAADRQVEGQDRAGAYGTLIENLATAYRATGRGDYAKNLGQVRERMGLPQ